MIHLSKMVYCSRHLARIDRNRTALTGVSPMSYVQITYQAIWQCCFLFTNSNHYSLPFCFLPYCCLPTFLKFLLNERIDTFCQKMYYFLWSLWILLISLTWKLWFCFQNSCNLSWFCMIYKHYSSILFVLNITQFCIVTLLRLFTLFTLLVLLFCMMPNKWKNLLDYG